MIGRATAVDGSALLRQIQQMIQQEPMFSGKPQLRVHPDDLQRVEQTLGPTLDLHGWRLLADSSLHPGGCKLSAEDGDLDASVATRWHELCRGGARRAVMTTRLSRWLGSLDSFEQRGGSAHRAPLRPPDARHRLVLEATGLQLPLGATCVIERNDGKQIAEVESEVVGFNGQKLFLMPLEEVEGILPGARVFARGNGDNAQSGKQLMLGPQLLGRVLDGSGRPLDGLPAPETGYRAPLITPPFNPLQRTPITDVLDTGVRAINALLTVGRGQRMGLFAGSGVGKSVLLGMMARYTKADVIVVGLIGERGREVKDFIENILGTEGRARSVVIAAPADVSPLLRMQGAAYATRIAEDFRDRGQHVLLIMDSLTRYAMAQREIALAIGEPPATKGYPPSVFAKLPALVERAGNGIDGGGSITAFIPC